MLEMATVCFVAVAQPSANPPARSPRNPSSEPTAKGYGLRGDTRGDIAERAATAFIALLIVFAVDSNNWIQRRTV
jgi:hypothetical protein